MPKNVQPSASVMEWLLDPQEPGARYLAMRDVLKLRDDHPELIEARHLAHTTGPIAKILVTMQDKGYWNMPGPGYLPKYFSIVWSLILLAQLGATVNEDERIFQACKYYLDHAMTPGGLISISNAPGGTVDCLQGNMIWALITLGCTDPRLDTAVDWMARSQTGEGVAPLGDKGVERRYYAGKCGPNFACGANDKQPCAWGAVKVLLAFSALPEEKRTPVVNSAIRAGVDFIFSIDPATAKYPHPHSAKPSGNWWKFGFPVFYVTDLLQLGEAMTGLGYGNDERLTNTLQIIRDKQDVDGHWSLEYGYSGKMHVTFGEMKKPNKWVTIRALKTINQIAV